MNIPDQEQINHWLTVAREGIQMTWDAYRNGYYKKKNIPIQSVYTGVAHDHASLARAKFLNGDPLNEVRAEFANATRHVLKSFTMAYDPTDPDYVGNRPPPPEFLGAAYGYADWSAVSEVTFIEGVGYALMAADFDLARTLAQWFRDPGNSDLADIEINRYAHALASTLRNDINEAKRLMTLQALGYDKKPVEGSGYRTNFFTVSTALSGILDDNEELFNQGLLAQLNFYQPYTRGEEKNTTREFICDFAVALANLGLHRGLKVTVEYDTLPKGLLITP